MLWCTGISTDQHEIGSSVRIAGFAQLVSIPETPNLNVDKRVGSHYSTYCSMEVSPAWVTSGGTSICSAARKHERLQRHLG